LGLNIRLKGYIYSNIYTPLDRGMALLQLCRWKFLNKETLQQSLFDWSWFLFTKMTNLLFEPPFGGLRGNVRISSIARSKARGRLPIRDSWTFFASSYGWDVISRYWWTKAHFRGGWVTLSANFRWKGSSPPNHCWYQKTRVFLVPHSEDRVIRCSFVWIGYQRVTDGRTDGQTDWRNCCWYYSALHCKQCGRAVKVRAPCDIAKWSLLF